MSISSAAEEMPQEPAFTGIYSSDGANTINAEPDQSGTYVGDLVTVPNTTGADQVTFPTITPTVVPASSAPQFFAAALPMQREVVLDDTELCDKTPKELLELIRQMREIEQMLDPILLKLIEDSAFAPQFDKLKKFRETNLEMLRLAMNIFNKKVETRYELAPATGKKRGR